ncbi:MAG: TonB-dependent receptor [Flavobacteriales bacterium]
MKSQTVIRILLLVLLIGIVFTSWSQAPPCNLILSGRVMDPEDGEALPFAQIICVELERGVLADSAGNYVFDGICPGEYTFMCRHLGCLPSSVVLALNSKTEHDFHLANDTQQLAEVAVISERNGYRAIQGNEQLSPKQLQLNQGKSLAEMMTGMSSVSILRNGATIGKPVVRGLHSNRVLIMNNGVRLEGQQWGNEHAPEIDPFIATRIQLIKGAASVRFGSDAIAGVVLVEPGIIRQAPGIDGLIYLAGISNGRAGVSSAMFQGRLKAHPSWSWRVHSTLKRGGNIKTPDYYLKNTGTKEFNYSGALAYQRGRVQSELYYSRFQSEIGIFSGAHIGNLTDLQLALDSEMPAETAGFTYNINRPAQKIDHELIKISAALRLKSENKLKWTYARQYNYRREFDKHVPLSDSLALLNKPALLFELTTHSLEALYESKSGKSITNTLGLQGMAQSNTYEGRFFIPNFEKNTLGIFAIERLHRPGSKLEWELGLRYDIASQHVFMRQGDSIVSPEFHYRAVSANAGFSCQRNDKLTLRMNLDSACRPPAINEMYSNGLHHGVAAIERGDPNLGVERSFGIELSGEYKSKAVSMEVQPFVQYIHQFIFLQPASEPVLTIRGAFPAFDYTQTNALLAGYDARMAISFSNQLQLGFKSSLLRAYNLETGNHLVQMPSDSYELTAGYHREKWRGLRDVFLNAGTLLRNKQWRVAATEDYAGSPSAYTICFVQLGCSIPMGHQLLAVSLACENIFNVSYREYLNRFRYYSDEIGRSLSLRLSVPFDFEKKIESHKE